ncbi:trigger factor [Butyrivibrio sp. X503]|uniref:trigger factor n=1 Tax=Butyrivibrio sp. X503 TaxID=2364878 RepID=UPI000EA9042A|nr:trigger factor [Butyrivibrio sp. X503]RKM54672.1 trigger factor [Butyrivibrio sp. X503]
MNKKIALVLAGVLMASSLSACNGAKKNNATEAESASASSASSEDDVASTMAIFKDIDKLETITLNDINPEEYVELGEYKGITIEIAPATVTDEQVEEYINNLALSSPLMTEITDRAVESGDVANIDFEGRYADTEEVFEGGTAQGYDLEIGSGSFIPGFEDGVIGMGVGESKDINLTFPEDYAAANLAGKEVIFKVTVNKISQKSTDITDEWAKSLAMTGVTDLESLKKNVRENLQKTADSEYDDQLREAILTNVFDNSTFKDIPEKLYNRFFIEERDVINSYVNTYFMYTGQQATAEDLVNMMMQNQGATGSPEDFIKNLVKDNANKFIMLAAIAKKEGLEVTDEDIDNYLKESYGDGSNNAYSTYEEFKEKVDIEVCREGLMAEKVMGFLKDNANVVEPVEK